MEGLPMVSGCFCISDLKHNEKKTPTSSPYMPSRCSQQWLLPALPVPTFIVDFV